MYLSLSDGVARDLIQFPALLTDLATFALPTTWTADDKKVMAAEVRPQQTGSVRTFSNLCLQPTPTYYYNILHPIDGQVNHMTEGETGNFWLGVVVGWVIMVIIDLFVPVIGPLAGGFAAGYIARGGAWNGGKAGVLAGILGGVISAILILIGATALLGGVGLLAGFFVGTLLVISVFLYLGILAFIGGAIAGAMRD